MSLAGAVLAVSGALVAGLAAAASDDYVFVDSFETTDCTLPPTCAVPSSGKACIAGQLNDVATTQPLHATFNVGLACGHGAIGGPCDLTIAAYDALQFESNPGATVPQASGAIVVDGCGRFRIPDLTVPGSPYVAIAAADAPGNAGHLPTATLHPLAPNQQLAPVNEPVARTDTVAAWSLLGQADFSNGAIVAFYATAGTPTAGVTVSRDGGSAGTVRYFSDADAQRLQVSTVATTTGANGAALIASPAYGNYSGAGGETNGCHWSSAVASAPPGVVVFVEFACQ